MGKYSVEKSIQILIAILKANNIRKVIVSPGTTNISLVVSMVNDGSFEMYSAVDERGAAYIACGLASESGEPVVITCTGSTASRNYYPGLTEAFYRKLPILAITASQDFVRNGNLSPQFIDRTQQPKDSVLLSVQIPIVRNSADEYDATIKINRAVTELFHHGGGPVHINLASSYTNDFSVEELPSVHIINRHTYSDQKQYPKIELGKKVGIIIGNHKTFSVQLTEAIDNFCAIYDAVVIVDHSSHYWGNYRVLPTILTCQGAHNSKLFDFELLIHIGEAHGDYYTEPYMKRAKEVWRISEDGEIRDTFGVLTNLFEMTELHFFDTYNKNFQEVNPKHDQRDLFYKEINDIYDQIPELPFSNIWIAQQIIPQFPSDACLELGVSNTMRSWTFFDFKSEVYVLANTGCRGIDGAIPTLVGMSLADPEKIHFAVMGDLTFFYSFNVLGNRHIGKNLRILLVNNGCGEEFNIYSNRAYKIYDGDHEKINEFIAAGNQTGTRSKQLVKHFAEDIGMKYMTASNKEEFTQLLPEFLNTESESDSIIFEVFTDVDEENTALKLIRNIRIDTSSAIKGKIKSLLGRK
ncbi:2-succinyl-5-enolpyruvyl-6-hydroxy-3-cyclohexene-1-carboxylate synthase [Ruminococcus albus]|uniref:Thiamine pyrophosphate binding domain-containing protein n=1 Tax=Ruminococcus albus (strain ATCC 27210 / DSM 20455 / JCM 14654 / NCDO 2250 / 7) TaxID=697329 RepID=E6UK55_RUMA7|nr:thiamine pyrophosphate-binding protein [Ruminococcus albus]ADU24051.1 thiamine pyrophosphate binding domain-containing protein [Ruminococcus albus 7 = DSM 20455]